MLVIYLRARTAEELIPFRLSVGFPGGLDGIYLLWRRPGFDLWVGKIPQRREWQPTLVFLPGEFHGQRGLVGTVHGVANSHN